MCKRETQPCARVESGRGEVSYSEFVDGCWKLQGEAAVKHVHVAKLSGESG